MSTCLFRSHLFIDLINYSFINYIKHRKHGTQETRTNVKHKNELVETTEDKKTARKLSVKTLKKLFKTSVSYRHG